MLIKVRKWLTDEKFSSNPVPLRTMRIVEFKRQTAKAVLVKLQGTPSPKGECMHCGKEITHPVSLHFGLGSTCILRYPELFQTIDKENIEASYERLKAEMSKITWEGWIPKAHFEYIEEDEDQKPEDEDETEKIMITDIVFLYDNQLYHVQTDKEDKIESIKKNADEIIRLEMVAI